MKRQTWSYSVGDRGNKVRVYERTPGGTILLGEPNLEESEECPPPADGPNHEGASYDKKRGACYRDYLLSVHAA